MAILLSILSIVLTYLSPADMFPELSKYHLQRFILAPAVVVSIGVLNARRTFHWPQYILIVGLWFAIVMSKLSRFKLGWAWDAFFTFGVVVCLYFLVAVNSSSLTRIKIICRALTFCGVIMSLQAIVAYFTGFQAHDLVLSQLGDNGLEVSRRVTGEGILHDPNDFAQFLVVGLALLGLSWSRDPLKNILFVFMPASILLVAIYLTFSRGVIFGLLAIAFVLFSKKAGVVKSLIACSVLFVILMAAHFGGGRNMSLNESSAAGRIVAWGSGISQLKHDPLFGVGFGEFTKYNDLTAHNSFVLCFAELGFFGYFFWIALLVTTIMGLEALARMPRKNEDDEKFLLYVTVIRSALYAFLATAWFLSRTYSETLYILIGMAGGLMYLRHKEVPEADVQMLRWVPITFVTQVASIVLIYLTIRLRSF
jgi:putative inorganic carbon (hco3(-)) transporter